VVGCSRRWTTKRRPSSCPGDVLLAFTDGVPEAHSPRTKSSARNACSAAPPDRSPPADEISARISAEMKNWIRDAEQYDDLTFIVMRRASQLVR
jgi:serine phosphatase RsbU (regulator of sigma subunit)